ncbi:hypothetical protein AB0910_16255 [Streptomyces sp. NPDC047002]|uniref:hypothetical protein n=1 Tax=Streptomyces sp. NPDC047002 TaxID=3155475 RepID=UPI003454C043
MKLRTYAVTAAAALLASGGLVALASSAQAALYTTCVGDGGAVTVRGDLVVPEGESCTLEGTKVTGTVTVRDGADLVASGVTLGGPVAVGDGAYLDVTGSTLKSAVAAAGAFGTHLQDSTVKSASAHGGFLYAVDTSVGGEVAADGGELYVSGSTVKGAVTGTGGLYADLNDTTVKGALTVTGNSLGGVLCASEVGGATAYRDNGDTLQLGGDGPLGSCAGASYLAKTLEVTGNTGAAVLDNTIVAGKLTATGNTPVLAVGPLARVRGGIEGETAVPAAAEAAPRALRPGARDRGQALAGQAAERAAAARSAAAAAGDAGL